MASEVIGVAPIVGAAFVTLLYELITAAVPVLFIRPLTSVITPPASRS
jgi:hypothetical protein